MIVISDTSPVSNLLQIGKLELLQQLFGKIIIPPVVDAEVRKLKQFSIDISSYTSAAWVEIVSPNAAAKVQQLMQKLDAGESEAIVIALEQGADLLLIDERAGTNIALSEGLTTIGLIGVLLKAKESGYVDKVGAILEELETIAGFWIGTKLKEKVLKDTGEITL